MSKCMEVCAKNFIAHFHDLVQKDPKIDVRRQLKENNKNFRSLFWSTIIKFFYYFSLLRAFGCYSLDVISSCCFGVDTNSIKDQDSEFIKNMQLILNNTLETNPAFLLIGKCLLSIRSLINRYLRFQFCQNCFIQYLK